MDAVRGVIGPGSLVVRNRGGDGVVRAQAWTALEHLVALGRVWLGVVLEHRAVPEGDDVVGRRAPPGIEMQVRLLPGDAVLAGCVAHGGPLFGRQVGARVPGLEDAILVVPDDRWRGPGSGLVGVPLVQVAQRHYRVVGVLVGFADPMREVIGRFDVVEKQESVALTGRGIDVEPLGSWCHVLARMVPTGARARCPAPGAVGGDRVAGYDALTGVSKGGPGDSRSR